MSTGGFASQFKEAGLLAIAARRPWREFLDISAISFPSSSSDATTRIAQNLTRFLFNYTLVLLIILFVSLIYHPFSIIVFLVVFVAWYFLFFSLDEPIRVFGVVVDDLVTVIVLGSVTIVALIWARVWVNVVVSLAIGAVVVCLHAVLRGTEDLVGEDYESPYGDLLSDSPRGGYSDI